MSRPALGARGAERPVHSAARRSRLSCDPSDAGFARSHSQGAQRPHPRAAAGVREFERLERAAGAIARARARRVPALRSEWTPRPRSGPQLRRCGARASRSRRQRKPHRAGPRPRGEAQAHAVRRRRAGRPRLRCSRRSVPRRAAARPRLRRRAVSRPVWRRRRCRGWSSRDVCGASRPVATRSSTRPTVGQRLRRPRPRDRRRRRRRPRARRRRRLPVPPSRLPTVARRNARPCNDSVRAWSIIARTDEPPWETMDPEIEMHATAGARPRTPRRRGAESPCATCSSNGVV
jgi:hypothetical protein